MTDRKLVNYRTLDKWTYIPEYMDTILQKYVLYYLWEF